MALANQVRMRCATAADAPEIARLIAIAGGGIPTWLWSRMAQDGEDPLAVGAARVARPDTTFSYRNAVLAEQAGQVAGMMLGYWLDGSSPGAVANLGDLPALLRPIAELERQVTGSFYINVLAVFDGYRDYGIGTRLLQAAASRATALGCTQLSAQTFSRNIGAVRLYERNGFRILDSRRIEPHPSHPHDDRILLMLRAL
ncbi:GNAT family N-acetyltransferase [Thalassobaculum sp.]|uniref:GNAT family N-acetyltransferase n=1 Tax=Thalassobaculum sp. TaxID=2022740 RepID=UPI0032EDF180